MSKTDGPLSLRDKCPNCGTITLELDPEGDIHCWGCGRTFGKPDERQDYLLERHQFYEKNKEAILADVQKIGEKDTAKKWKINGASPYHVLQRWEREANQVNQVEKNVAKRKKMSKRAQKVNTYERHNHYAANKDAIIEDLLQIGRMPTCFKWGMPKSSLQGFIEKWLTPEQQAAIPRAVYTPIVPVGENGRLPHFPEFSTKWDAAVQLKWFELYDKLLDRHS
jgi:uncharacterized Zn finger protein (UPF0148 family)